MNKYTNNNNNLKYKNHNVDHNQMDNNNFKVVIRIRPFSQREIESGRLLPTLQVLNDHKMIQAIEYYNHDFPEGITVQEILENTNRYTIHQFTFDHVFNHDASQLEVYEYTAKPAVQSMLKGYNATILAYGQTGTGKTHTMEGFKYSNQDPQRGIIPRSMEEIFRYIENISNSKTTFMVRASYLQIYNETISDLLRTDRTNLMIREDKKKGLYVEGLSEWAVRGPSEIYSLIQKGAASRATASTKMNDVSSRSHAVFVITVEQMMETQENDRNETSREIRVGKLNLVDLAGSERIRVTGATGQRLEECKKINQSLSALGNVISALADQKQPKNHIPYRDSKITRLLEDSLGGNCITTMMTMVSPSMDAFFETLSSIKFANRAKNIRNAPVINEDGDQKALLRKYESELKRLRSELEEKNKTLIDKKKLFELEEERKKAEMHKVAAVAALEARSKEFMQEREEKKKLEEKIRSMNSQLLVGGRKIEDTPQFRNALEEQQKIIRQQYEKRLQDLEKERSQIEEDKVQADRYKQLLLKQRDIMIALTARLNERDETIIQLQEELDAYDRIHKETGGHLETEKSKNKKLEQILKDHNITLPLDQDNISLNKMNLSSNANSNSNSDKRDNPDVVTYDGEETYNITKENLLNAEEKINELTRLNTNQKEEIQKLKKELELFKASGIENIDKVNNELVILQDKLKKSEEAEYNLAKLIQKKDDELKNIQNANDKKYNGINVSISHQIEMKKSIDNIIECLSRKNEHEQLQEIAKKLLHLQKLINIISPISCYSSIMDIKLDTTNNINSSSYNHYQKNKNIQNEQQSKPLQNSQNKILHEQQPSKHFDDQPKELTNGHPDKELKIVNALENPISSTQSGLNIGTFKSIIPPSNDLTPSYQDTSILASCNRIMTNPDFPAKVITPSSILKKSSHHSQTSNSLRGEMAKLIRSRIKSSSNENALLSHVSNLSETSSLMMINSSINSSIVTNNSFMNEKGKGFGLGLDEESINKKCVGNTEELLRLKRDDMGFQKDRWWVEEGRLRSMLN